MTQYVRHIVRACIILATLPTLATLSCCDRAKADTPPADDARLKRITYQVELIDPVSPMAAARAYDLFLSLDSAGFPVEYTLSFETHVCTDGQCKVVAVTMAWNAPGYFGRLRCPPGAPLTKKEHAPFTARDYAKLDRILKDRDSMLAEWTIDFIELSGETGIDAIAMPTPVKVQDAVVKDAAFTSWALWHWANGEIVEKLRGITRQHCTPAYLNHLLVSKDRRFSDFSLAYVMKQHPSDPQFVDGVFHIIENGEPDQIARALEFVSRAMSDTQKLHDRLIESCCRMRPADCPMILYKLAVEPNLPAATLESLTSRLAQLPYFPVHLVLRILEEREFASEKTISNVAALLDSENFFIARRAYEHLAEQELDADTRKKVSVFRDQNQRRL